MAGPLTVSMAPGRVRVATSPRPGPAFDVDLELILAVDVSGSMSDTELFRQRTGYVAAFRHPEVFAAIASGALGRIAVAYLEWAGPDDQWLVVPWTILASAEDATSFAASLDAARLKPDIYTVPDRRAGRRSRPL